MTEGMVLAECRKVKDSYSLACSGEVERTGRGGGGRECGEREMERDIVLGSKP